MAVLYSNNASSTLSASITSTATSLSVASGAGALFPAPSGADYFYITLVNSAGAMEIMKVTARSADTLTVVRGQDGTTGVAWAAGDRVELRFTRAMLDDIKGERMPVYGPSVGSGGRVMINLSGNPAWSDANFTYDPITASFRAANLRGAVGDAAPTWNFNNILHAGNYSSYALPLGGGTLTGTLNVNANDGLKATYGGTDGDTWYRGWGMESNRTTVYIRPTTNGVQSLRIGYSENTQNWIGVRVDANTFTHNGYTVLNANNYTSYVPAMNQIVYGNANSASNGISATQNVYDLGQYKSGFWDVYGASWMPDTSWYWGGTFAHTSNNGAYNYSGQIAFQNGSGGNSVYLRTISNGSPSSWVRILTSGNYTSYGDGRYVLKTGDTMTGKLGWGTSMPNNKKIIGIYESGNLWTGIGMAAATASPVIAGDGSVNNLLDVGYYSLDGAFTWISRAQINKDGIVAVGSRNISLNTSNGYVYSYASSGGWAMGHGYYGSSGTYLGAFGAYGGVDSLTYFFVGQDYNNASMTWSYSDINAIKPITLGGRSNSTTFGGNTSGMSGNAFVAEVRATGNKPTLTFHYENIATTHIEHLSDGSLNVWRPSNEGTSVLKVGGNVALHAGNYTNYTGQYVLKTGDTMTGTLKINTTGSGSATSHVIIKRSGAAEPSSFGSYNGSWRSSLEIWNNNSTKMLFMNSGETDFDYAHIKSVNSGLVLDVGSNGGVRAFAIGTDGTVKFDQGESINLYGARGRYANQYMHLYSKVGVGHPSGWGQGETNTPSEGLSTYGGINIAYGTNAASTFSGRTQFNRNGRSTSYVDSNIEVYTGDNTPPSIAFHRGGYSATSLYESDGELFVNAWVTRSQNGKLISSGNISSYAAPASHDHSRIGWVGTRTAESGTTNSTPSGYMEMVGAYNNGWPNQYGNVLSMNGGGASQLYMGWFGGSGAETGELYYRSMTDWRTNWGSWRRVLTNANWSEYAAPISHTHNYVLKTGDTMTGRLTIDGSGWTTNNRNYSNEWIEFGNYSGLYSPNNSAHFYPNNGTYGSWRVAGSRNGWAGIEFDASNGNVQLMIEPSSNTSGFHNNSYGWQFRWNNGTAYVYKNAYGGGTAATVLDSSNYTNYKASDSDRLDGYDSYAFSATGSLSCSGDFQYGSISLSSNSFSLSSATTDADNHGRFYFYGTSGQIISRYMPIDKAGLYRMKIRWKASAANTTYIAVFLLDTNGNNISGAGSYWAYPWSGGGAPTAWQTNEWWYDGSSFPSNAAYVAFGISHTNYSGGNATYYVSQLEMERVNKQISGNTVLHAGNYTNYVVGLGGGTLTGNLSISGSSTQIFFTGNTAATLIQSFSGIDTKFSIYNSGTSIGISNALGTLNLVSSSGVLANGNTILHAGNYTSYGDGRYLRGDGTTPVTANNLNFGIGRYFGYTYIQTFSGENLHLNPSTSNGGDVYIRGNLALHAGNISSYVTASAPSAISSIGSVIFAWADTSTNIFQGGTIAGSSLYSANTTSTLASGNTYVVMQGTYGATTSFWGFRSFGSGSNQSYRISPGNTGYLTPAAGTAYSTYSGTWRLLSNAVPARSSYYDSYTNTTVSNMQCGMWVRIS